MNIYTVIFLIAYFYDFDIVVENTNRGTRRDATTFACIRRRNTAKVAIKNFDGKVHQPYRPDFDVPGLVDVYGKVTKTPKGKVSHRWDTFYFKTRSIIDTGRIHVGDKKRKGKRPYCGEHADKVRFQQLLKDYEEE